MISEYKWILFICCSIRTYIRSMFKKETEFLKQCVKLSLNLLFSSLFLFWDYIIGIFNNIIPFMELLCIAPDGLNISWHSYWSVFMFQCVKLIVDYLWRSRFLKVHIIWLQQKNSSYTGLLQVYSIVFHRWKIQKH